MTPGLPEPGTTRWQPLRAGLIDLFYYDAEEFWFRDGRLLLRGNNGTGKSKVLALTLPFLLDGELSPYRVEPDADPKKRMEWNLLLGGEHPYPERLGYTWLELGRTDDDGSAHYRTVGCGLKAVSGRGVVRHWFFVTSQRPGDDLRLVDATGTALSRDRLADALSAHGTVYDRATDYRRAVDETLFGLGTQRYRAMVDLLIQLRQPQLSKRPSERALSDALTEALSPVDQAVVADVADAFRSLEDDRNALAAASEARDAAAAFLDHYRRYAQVATRRKAAGPRNAQSAYERVNRDLAAAETAYQEAHAALQAAQEQVAALDAHEARLRAREQELRTSPQMRDASRLEQLDAEAKRCADDAARIAEEHHAAQQRLDELTDRAERAAERLTDVEAQLTAARQTALDEAAGASLDADHRERVDAELDGTPDLDGLRQGAEELIGRQQRAITQVRTLIGAHGETVGEVTRQQDRMTEIQQAADELAQRRADADETVTAHGAALVAAVRDYLAAARELRLADPAATLAELELWVDTLDGANPAAAAVGEAAQRAADELAAADAGLASQRQATDERTAEVHEAIGCLEAGEQAGPPPAHTRDADARTGRPGAPLWQVVDFAEHVGRDERAGLEAALEAAGILDAWVTPDGQLLAADTDDVIVRPGEPAAQPLSTLLRADARNTDPQVAAPPKASVAAVLDGIGLDGDAGTWISVDGRFGLGVLEGRWRKPAATFIGDDAREEARQARLAWLREELAALEAEAGKITEQQIRVADRKAALADDVRRLPGDTDLQRAHAVVAGLVGESQRLRARRSAQEAALAAAHTAAESARSALVEAAQDAGLPHEPDALASVESAVGAYRTALVSLWSQVRAVDEARLRAAEAAADQDQQDGQVTGLADRLSAAQQESAAAHERHETLRQSVGATVAELQQQLAEVADQLRQTKEDQARAAAAEGEAREARGKADGQRQTLADELADATAKRGEAAEAFRRFAGTGLLTVAVPGLDIGDPGEPWAPDPAVRLARRVNEALADVDDDDAVWDRVQRRVTDELKLLQDSLSRQGNWATGDLREDGVVVEVEFRGKPATVPELVDTLNVDVADRERLLSEREREILENHLIGEVASTLQELITAAEDQVAAMNAELQQRPTSTGMQLRLRWKPREDGPAGLAEARQRLLYQMSDAWSSDDRAAVGSFLEACIAEVRAADPTGTWLEHLTHALDYRRWHRFVIERRADGTWRSATGPASGGERALAATVPLFAAASSHFSSSGTPHAPRLVTLDEAFAGVDDNARAKYLGLLTAFDLDVVMTSEREWGCYPEVPGLAIAHMSRKDGVPAVLVSNWEWDGAERVKVERPVHPVAPAADDEPAQGLFG